jgi:hypothetical protein
MSGSPEKRRDCIAQLPLRPTSGGSKFASEQLNFLFNLGRHTDYIETPVTEILRLPTVKSKPRPREMLGTATVSCPSVFDPFILSRSSSRSSTDRTKGFLGAKRHFCWSSDTSSAVPHLLLRELRGEVLEKLPPRLEIALHCNEHSRRNVLTAKKAGLPADGRDQRRPSRNRR